MYEHVKARPGGRRQPMLRAEGQAATSDQKPSRVVVKDFKSSDERDGSICINSPCRTFVGFSVESDLKCSRVLEFYDGRVLLMLCTLIYF